jgi:hypothetical protein
MKMGIKLAASALCLAAFVGAASTASAGIGWREHHPRRAEVNARLGWQSARITHERRDGQITSAQARDLHGEDRGIRDQERFDASHDDGHITKGEQRQLNQEENGVSQQIGH